jgi:hypothetical protein
MDFSDALREIKNGGTVARSGWNGKGQWIYWRPSTEDLGDFLAIHPVSGPDVPWLASQTDLLAEDWVVTSQ